MKKKSIQESFWKKVVSGYSFPKANPWLQRSFGRITAQKRADEIQGLFSNGRTKIIIDEETNE